MLENRDLLIYYALVHNGDWNKIYDSILHYKDDLSEDRYESFPKKLREQCITILDKDIYPAILANIPHPPFVLFYKGNIDLLKDYSKFVAIVGTREPSELGIKATNMIVDSLPRDYTVISGMAAGIDSTAHLRAIQDKLKTIAISPVGINTYYPSSSKDLYHELCRNHLVLSEHPFSELIPLSSFPFRNRIIVGLTNTVFIPEAYEKSGTLLSVHLALSFGREVVVVPHPFDANTANNRLIKDGADLVENAIDVLEVLTK